MNKIFFIICLFLSSCSYNVREKIIKIPKTSQNLEIFRQCQQTVATASISGSAYSVKRKCYETLDNKKIEIREVRCPATGSCDYLLKKISDDCVYADSVCDDDLDRKIDKIDLNQCHYFLCEIKTESTNLNNR